MGITVAMETAMNMGEGLEMGGAVLTAMAWGMGVGNPTIRLRISPKPYIRISKNRCGGQRVVIIDMSRARPAQDRPKRPNSQCLAPLFCRIGTRIVVVPS
jgi:hypothetical protein